MVDNRIEGAVIGVAFDGLGYGTDGNLWGGEFLVADLKNFQRRGHLKYIAMPGGTQAIKEPWRMAMSYLYQIYGEDFPELELNLIKMFDKRKVRTIAKMLSKRINSPLTSSVGRLFDAISALLDICSSVNYEGQAAIELEMAIKSVQAVKSEEESYDYEIEKRGQIYIIDPIPIIKGVLKDLQREIPISVISEKFHNTIAGIIVEMCRRISQETNRKRVVLSGGVFQNMFLLRKTVTELHSEDFKVYTHHRVPTNDGGISLGQAAIAMEKLCA
jgi:hydrogenase maturation protein HypF